MYFTKKLKPLLWGFFYDRGNHYCNSTVYICKPSMKRNLLISSFVLAVFAGCSKSNDSTNPPNNNTNCSGTKSFTADVHPIFQSVCSNAGCHEASSTNGPGPLTNYQQIFNARTSIRSAVSSGTMPKNTTLSATQKNAILCWIDTGAPNN